MKRINIFLAIILLFSAGCGRGRHGSESDDFITVDVTRSFPKKELILQDFMDVEYIPLETGGEFYCQGIVRAIGKDIIIVTNSNQINDGDIFFFDRAGKGLRKINRKGNSSEEYTNILGITLDEDNGEMFVNNSSLRKILVYDLYGNFLRSFRHKEGTTYFRIYNYDNEYLICHDIYAPHQDPENFRNSFFIISKQDGNIKEVEIPFRKKLSTLLVLEVEEGAFFGGPRNCLIIPFQNNWILTEPSSDTVYRCLPDYSLHPFIVRTPSVQTTNPEVFLFPTVLTDSYYFMQTVKKEYDFATQRGMPTRDLMYDRNEKSIYEHVVYNDDYSDKKTFSMIRDIVNEEIAFYQTIEADHLVEYYEIGALKGKLKEIASELKEEDNPVIMLIKHKK